MKLNIYIVPILTILLASCSTNSRPTSSTEMTFEADSISLKLKYNDVYFVVPSPIQTSILLKNSGIEFNEQLIYQVNSLEKFTTTAQKALVLGILGADLSYLNLYEQREKALKYLHLIEVILDDLKINPSITKDLLKKIENNFGNNDSILYFLSEIYRNGDLYLKANDRRDICSLIIAGGWIESFYFLTKLYQENKKDDIFDLILYQIDILENLIKLISPFYEKSPEYTQLIDDLVNIAYEFDVVDKTESIVSIKTDSMQRKTNINNPTKHLLSGTKLEHLSEYVQNLKNKIVQN